jgi:hypothetical protein
MARRFDAVPLDDSRSISPVLYPLLTSTKQIHTSSDVKKHHCPRWRVVETHVSIPNRSYSLHLQLLSTNGGKILQPKVYKCSRQTLTIVTHTAPKYTHSHIHTSITFRRINLHVMWDGGLTPQTTMVTESCARRDAERNDKQAICPSLTNYYDIYTDP